MVGAVLVPVNQVAGLVIVDVDVDCDADVAVTGGVGVVADYDCVVLAIAIVIFGVVIPVVEPLILVSSAVTATAAGGEGYVVNPEIVLLVPVLVVHVDPEVVGAVLAGSPVLLEPVTLPVVNRVLGVDSVNPLAGLVIVDVDVDRDVDVAVTGGVGVVADYDCVVLVILIGVLGRVIPVVEPLVLVTLATATATAVGEVDIVDFELVLVVVVFIP